jgi:hypothetical protein
LPTLGEVAGDAAIHAPRMARRSSCWPSSLLGAQGSAISVAGIADQQLPGSLLRAHRGRRPSGDHDLP